MKLKELDYQRRYVSKLKEQALEYLADKETYVIVFQAPTGSGKTVMMAQALTDIVKNPERKNPLSFIWISVNSLHEQSRESLERFFDSEKLLHCSSVSEIDGSQI